MKFFARVCLYLFLLILPFQDLFGQGASIPFVKAQWSDSNGLPVALGRICTYTAGTLLPLPTYSDSALTVANTNPIQLDAAGRAPTAVFISGAKYKIVMHSVSVGAPNTCPYAGTVLWTQDQVGAVAQFLYTTNLFNVRICDQFAGSTADAKITACIADLPSTGGVADATGFEGSQSWAGCPVTGVTKNVTLKLGASTSALAVDCTFPSNVAVWADQGGIISVGSGKVLTICGAFDGTMSTHFAGSGTVYMGVIGHATQGCSTQTPSVYPQWWGAKGDGRFTNDCAITNGTAALTSASLAFTSADVGKMVVVTGAAASGKPGLGTISAVTNGTAATVSFTAGSTVSGALCELATNDAAALQSALTASLNVRILPGNYCGTTLRLRQSHQLTGTGVNTSRIWRCDVGSVGGSFVKMVSGDVAEQLYIHNLGFWCNQIFDGATALNGIELGTETPALTEFATTSLIDTVQIFAPSGIGLYLRSNAGIVRNLWVLSVPTLGTPTTLTTTTSIGMQIDGSQLIGTFLDVEGNFGGGEVKINAPFTSIDGLHIESRGVYAAVDAVTINADEVTLRDIFACGVGVTTRRDIIRILAGGEFVNIFSMTPSPGGCGTYTFAYAINDVNRSINIPNTYTFIPRFVTTDTPGNIHEQFWAPLDITQNITMNGGTPTLTMAGTGGTTPNIVMSGGTPTITIDNTAGRDFSIRVESSKFVVRDLSVPLDVFTIDPATLAITLSSGASIISNTGAPGGACTRGSLFMRTDNFGAGAVLYACENAAWVAK